MISPKSGGFRPARTFDLVIDYFWRLRCSAKNELAILFESAKKRMNNLSDFA